MATSITIGASVPIKELPDPKGQVIWLKDKSGEPFGAAWGSTDIRYPKNPRPEERETKITLSAWRGERVNLQAVVWNNSEEQTFSFSASDLKGASFKIASDAIAVNAVGYVMTDGLYRGSSTMGCFPKDYINRDSSLIADVLLHETTMKVASQTTRPVWLSIHVPSEAAPGLYKGKLEIQTGKQRKSLSIELRVVERQLPPPSQWSFHLDLWQNPFSVARYYGVTLWSEEHFEKMRPLMTRLANAGQKVITTTLMYEPWGGQTYDLFNTMILRYKRIDGTWQYNFDIFDRYVAFMFDCGIDRQISCYTIIPWEERYQYFDEATNSHQYVKAELNSEAYKAYWTPFFEAFVKHLQEKGWLDKTVIAMDERPADRMRQAIAYLNEIAPSLKIGLAGNHHPDIQEALQDYCVALRQRYDLETKEARRNRGQVSTFYTCCVEDIPNTFTFSPPAESTWLMWHAAAESYDGYLRWAYNSWNEEPLLDSRYGNFSGGDCFFVYPDNQSSIRFEKMIEGIQDYEKIRLLREEYIRKNDSQHLQRLDALLQPFSDYESLRREGAAGMLKNARGQLNY